MAYVIFEVWEKIRDILNGEYDGAASGQVFDAQNSQVVISSGGTEGAGTPGNPVMTGTSVTLECEAVQQPWVYSGFCPDPLYSWVFGDGTGLSASSSNQLVSHVYNQPGSYEAQCTVQCPTVVFTQTAGVGVQAQPPNAQFAVYSGSQYGTDFTVAGPKWKALKRGDSDGIRVHTFGANVDVQLDIASSNTSIQVTPSAFQVVTGESPDHDSADTIVSGSASQVFSAAQLTLAHNATTLDTLNVNAYEERVYRVAYRRVDSQSGYTSTDIASPSTWENEVNKIWNQAVVDIARG